MVSKTTSNKRLRDVQRAVHLAVGLLVAAYMYTPLPDVPILGALVQFAGIPLLIATGMGMWQLPRLRSLLARNRRMGRTQQSGSA